MEPDHEKKKKQKHTSQRKASISSQDIRTITANNWVDSGWRTDSLGPE